MLDLDMKQQLKEVFSALESNIELVYFKSDQADQPQLLQMLSDVAETSSKIKVIEGQEKQKAPGFRVYKNNQPTGIIFKGIPGGHEFTSFILAILNTDLKGKMPDQVIINKIKSLKGPIRLKTYMSLTCENCPEVVQALNLMSTLHADFTHETVDGLYVQDEIEALGIQGVPSVVVDGKLIHSGKISFIDLLEKLVKYFGVDQQKTTDSKSLDLGIYDVVVIGGGPAGASAAIYSVRKGLKTALIAERFGGQVQDTKGIENLISVVYTEGPDLAAQLNKHVSSYPVKILEHRKVVKVNPTDRMISLSSGEFIKSQSIIIATGAKWRELNIPGEKDYLGRGVAYCPHCDGPYYKGKKVAVVGGGNSGVEAAIDLAGIVKEVVLFEYSANLKADQVLVDKLLSLPNVKVKTSAKSLEVVGDGAKVNSLKYEDMQLGAVQTETLEGIFVQIGLLPNSDFVKDVVQTNKFGEIIVDEKGRTSAVGIYAAGDVTTVPFKQIIISMGEGAKAALAAFEDRIRGR